MQKHENAGQESTDETRGGPPDWEGDAETKEGGKTAKWQTPSDLRAASNISRQIDALPQEQKDFVLDYVRKRYPL